MSYALHRVREKHERDYIPKIPPVRRIARSPCERAGGVV
jgi:hypothetical protein